MAFTALDVKKLREMTNVGMMDCKAALAATDGDMDKAVDWLRERAWLRLLRRLTASLLKALLTLPTSTASALSSRSTPRPTSLLRPKLSWTWLRTWLPLLLPRTPLMWRL